MRKWEGEGSYGKALSYDSQNQLVSINSGAMTIVYDGDGNRVEKIANGVVKQYLVDDLNPTGYPQVVEELSSGVVTRQYTYGLQRISENQVVNSTWTPSFYGYDGGGSVRQLTSAAGTVTDTYEYDAFGNEVNSTGSMPNDYLYRGEQFDSDLGLYYLRARYYNPLTGRFMSRDPLDHSAVSPNELHKYLYASGDPIDAIDPSGRGDLREYADSILLVGAYLTQVPLPVYWNTAHAFCEAFETLELGLDAVQFGRSAWTGELPEGPDASDFGAEPLRSFCKGIF